VKILFDVGSDSERRNTKLPGKGWRMVAV